MVNIYLFVIIFFVLIFVFLKTDDPYKISEIIIDNIVLTKREDEPLGLRIGGWDDITGVQIDNITEGGSAYNAGLKLNDSLLELDGVNVENSSYDEVLNLLKSVKKILNIKVSRKIKEFKQ